MAHPAIPDASLFTGMQRGEGGRCRRCVGMRGRSGNLSQIQNQQDI
ncbi:MAG: hypothetical protein NUW12_12725 [Firmicutes bacterium]|nr:hypothetical protein [Bacillota bacterium]MDH7496745.1 hypothetical protein [Bacillota bacterium]